MKHNVQLKGQLKLYMQWPAIMAILLVAMNIWILMIDKRAGLLMSVFVLIYIVAVLLLYFHSKSLVLSNLVDTASRYGFLQNGLLKDLSVPYAVMMADGLMIWANDSFREIFSADSVSQKYLSNYIPELNRSVFPREDEAKLELSVQYNARYY